jgi:glycosyltransferase involved in cell wall biosynthesis
MARKVVIIGPAHPLRGGLATFDHRLCKAFSDLGYDCRIYSFSLQYPGFLFPGKSQYTDDPAPQGIRILTLINSINPLNWIKVGRRLKAEAPTLLIVRFWIPLMGPALGSIIRLAKRNGACKVVAITDNVIPHEKRPGDRLFTRYFLNSCDAFVCMSDQVQHDLRKFEPFKPVKKVWHPLYDNFGEAVDKKAARTRLQLPTAEKIVLFFGFIRAYKGLDILFRALQLLKETSYALPGTEPGHSGFKVVIAGEFYENRDQYDSLIRELQIEDMLILKTDFIPDQEVKYYFCAADVVVQPYRSATQSGVTPLAYHFEKPMIVTNVGSLPDLVPDEKVGLVCTPDPEGIASALKRFFALGEPHFLPHLRAEKQKYSWHNLVTALTSFE